MKAPQSSLILSLMLLSCISLTGQSIKVVYHATSTNAVREISPELSQRKITYSYSLTIHNGISKYSRDSVYLLYDQSDGKEYWPYKEIYKDYNNGVWLEKSGRYKEGYLYEQNLDELREKSTRWKWTVTEEQKAIAGIPCRRAIAKNGDVAWYAPDIPYLDGPRDGVFSLPGLVLEYETNYYKWSAVEVLFNAQAVTLPDGIPTRKKNAIQLSYNDVMALGKKQMILIDAQTPQKTWLKFER